MSTSKSVTIQIDPDDMKVLVDGGYNLCFAKKVGDNDFNVVWQSFNSQQYETKNTFSWTPVYQVYGSNQFTASVVVDESCGPQTIGLGQTSTLDKYSSFSSPVTGGSSLDLTVMNNYGPIHIGVSQLCTDINGVQQTTPIYLSENQFTTGSVVMEPVEEVMVWFETKVETSTMFVDARSNAQVIDMTNQNSATYLYQKGNWVIPSTQAVNALEVEPLTIVLTATAALIAGDFIAKIASKLTGVFSCLTVECTPVSGTSYKVTYKTKPGITNAERQCSRTLLAGNSTIDSLLVFVIEALSSQGQGFINIQANGPAQKALASISGLHSVTPMIAQDYKRIVNG